MDNIQEIFKKRKRNQILASIIFAILMVTFVIASDYIVALPLAIVTTIAIVVGIIATGLAIFSFKNWRCPSCNKYLGKSINPKYCPSCGKLLVSFINP